MEIDIGQARRREETPPAGNWKGNNWVTEESKKVWHAPFRNTSVLVIEDQIKQVRRSARE